MLLKGAGDVVAEPDGDVLVVDSRRRATGHRRHRRRARRDHRRAAGRAACSRCTPPPPRRGCTARRAARARARLGRQRPARPDSGGAGRAACEPSLGVGRGRPRRDPPTTSSVLCAVAAPAAVWAVVKADGYGHGGVPVARAALDGGAAGLCVALVQEGVELRDAGIDVPDPGAQRAAAADAGRRRARTASTLTVYSLRAGRRARRRRRRATIPVHLKVDTGMHRVGAAAADALALAATIARVAGASGSPACCTHLAVADEPDDPYTDSAARIVRRRARRRSPSPGIDRPLVHAANSAGALAHPGARAFDMVRAGIAIYGISPGPALDQLAAGAAAGAVAAGPGVVRQAGRAAGDRISYGLRHRFAGDTTVATLPDRLRRRRAAAAVRRRRRGADRRPAPPDRRRRHDGPADGRLRRRRRRRRRRGGADRRQGDESIPAEEWADAARHDRLRDRLRHLGAHRPATTPAA